MPDKKPQTSGAFAVTLEGAVVESMRPPDDDEALFVAGEILSDTYEIRRLLGKGGMSAVFEAYDVILRRYVAIKAARDGTLRAGTSLLSREAQALANVRHPGLVTLHAAGSHRGIDYLVLERLYGTTLDVHLQAAGRGLPLLDALNLLTALAEVLSAVHRAGLAHRDVKPANVMLGQERRIVLLDLGIVQPEATVGEQRTIAGTPEYMAPETIRSGVRPGAAHLVDIYALGVLAYEVLVGKRPYAGRSVHEVFDLHLMADVPRVIDVRHDVPDGLSELVRHMMSKDPDERPGSADVVSAQLRAIRARAELDAATRAHRPFGPAARTNPGLQVSERPRRQTSPIGVPIQELTPPPRPAPSGSVPPPIPTAPKKPPGRG